MDLADGLIICLTLLAVNRGYRSGAAVGVLTFVGYAVGLLVGAVVAARVLGPGTSPLTSTFVRLGLSFGFAAGVSTVGRLAGLRLWRAMRSNGLRFVDAVGGGVLSGLWVLVASWLAAAVLVSLPIQAVAQQIDRSVVLQAVDGALPPPPAALSRLGHLLDPVGFPQVFNELGIAPAAPVQLPSDPAARAAAARAVGSTFKIIGNGCGGIVEGTGFVAATDLMITNAHVVAGIAEPTVATPRGILHATPILFDKNLDLAVLRVPGLAAPALSLADVDVAAGTTGAVVGYPGGGPETVVPAAVLREQTAVGRDIYGQSITERDVYELQAQVRPGNSGGPIVRADGTVVGVVFSRSTTNDNVGYALTSPAVLQRLRGVESSSTAVATGSCAN